MLRRLSFTICMLSCCIFIVNAQNIQLFPGLLIKSTPYLSTVSESSDGGYFMGSLVDHINGQRASNLSKADASGNLVTSFGPVEVDDHILKSQELSDGKILICGWFNKVNGVASAGIARLNADGTLDETFQMMNLASFVYFTSFLVQPSGKIVVIGNFSLLGYNNIARLNANGSLDVTFFPYDSTGPIPLIDSDSDQNIILGVGNGVVKLDVNGNPIAGWPDVDVNGNLYSMEVADNLIYVGGIFDSVANVPRQNFALINADGSLNDLGIAGLNFINKIAVDATKRIYVNNMNYVSVFDSLGVFQTNIGTFVPENLLIDSQSRILITGADFLKAYNEPNAFTIRFNSDLSIDNTFHCETTSANGVKRAIVADNAGRIIVAIQKGANSIGAQPNRIVRLLPNGEIDPTFLPAIPASESFESIVIQEDNKIAVSTGYALLRMLPDGAIDETFQVTPIELPKMFHCMKRLGGSTYVGGYFDELNAIATSAITRLNDDGTIDPTFISVLPSGSYVNDIEIQSDGKLIIIGGFPFNDGNRCIARMNQDGSLDDTFLMGRTGYAASQDVAIDSRDNIYFVGAFEDYSGSGRSNFVRLNADGILDLSFIPVLPFSGVLSTVALSGDNEIIVGNGSWYSDKLAVYDSLGSEISTPFDEMACSLEGSFTNQNTVYLAGRFITPDKLNVSSLAVYKSPFLSTLTTLTAEFNTDSVAALSWTSDALTATHFIIERSETFPGGYVAIDTVLATVSTYTDAGASTEGFHFYRVLPVNAFSSGEYSNTAVVLGSVTANPASSISNNSFTAEWGNVLIADAYNIQVSTDNFATILSEYESVANKITVTGLAGLTQYAYRVQYRFGDKLSLFSNTVSVTTSPNPPSGVTVTALSPVETQITWVNIAPAPISVRIERALHREGPFEQIVSLSGDSSTYHDLSVQAETTYYYRLMSLSSDAESDFSMVASVTTPERLAQTIAFKKISAKVYGNDAFTLTATASSALAVIFVSSDPNILSITGNTATIHHAGTVTITARQEGNLRYQPATTLQKLAIGKALQTIAFDELPFKHSMDEPFTLFASASSGLPLAFTSSDETTASIIGSVVTILQPGLVEITATQSGSNDYHGTWVKRTLQIGLVTGFENILGAGLEVYPNPGSGLYTITLPFGTNTRSVLYNLNGNAAEAELFMDGNKLLVDIRHLPNGMYILEVQHELRSAQLKIIKQ